jgi:transcriptional regulator with XRE-family HTH domain
MSKTKISPIPLLMRILAETGENIRLARLRRKLPATMIAERAGIARNTLRAIERGDSSVAFGAYANVLLSLGLENDLRLIGKDDELGRKLQDAGLAIKARAPKAKSSVSKLTKNKNHE